MDDQRFEELKTKRSEEGLTDEEANELGRMYAEREGEPYSNAADRAEAEEQVEGVVKPEQLKDVLGADNTADRPAGSRTPLGGDEQAEDVES